MTTASVAPSTRQDQRLQLLRVLGPGHVWALGVGIVLVGEYMGWNFSVGKGGMVAGLRVGAAGGEKAAKHRSGDGKAGGEPNRDAGARHGHKGRPYRGMKRAFHGATSTRLRSRPVSCSSRRPASR